MNDQRKAQKQYEEKLADRFVQEINRRFQADFILTGDLREHPSWPDFEYSDAKQQKQLVLELTTLVRHDQILGQVKRALHFGKKLQHQLSKKTLPGRFVLNLYCEYCEAKLEDDLLSQL